MNQGASESRSKVRSSFSECEQVLTQWNESQNELYRVRSSDLKWNLTEQNFVDYQNVILFGVPAVAGLASMAGISAGLSERTLWLSLWGRIQENKEDEFVNAICSFGRAAGKSRFVIGADEFHFVPGVPLVGSCNGRLQAALIKSGFAGSEEVDYQGNPHSLNVDRYIDEASKLASEKKWRTSLMKNDEEKSELELFLSEEFPGRWTREFRFWRSRSDTSRAFWLLLKNDNDKILGFSRIAIRGRLNPLDVGWTPGALRLPFRGFESKVSNKDSCLGPIGVSSSLRGQGAGKVILASVLANLQKLDAGPLCIDWTNAFKYYEPLDFTIVRRFATMCKV